MMYESLGYLLCRLKPIINQETKRGNMRMESLTKTAAMLTLLGIAAFSGCTGNNPMNSADGGSSNGKPSSVQGQVELYGRASSIDSTSRTITLVNQPVTIVVDPAAEVVFKDGGGETPTTLGSILPGDSLEVRGDMQGNGTLLANRVRVRPDENNELELRGRVSQIDPVARTIMLADNLTLIVVAPAATIVHKISSAELPITLDEIAPGDSVEVRGATQLDGSLLADRVRLRDEDTFESELEFKGSIASVDHETGIIYLNERPEAIRTDSLTFIFSKQEQDTSATTSFAKRGADDSGDDTFGKDDIKVRITLAHLSVGDTVEIHANRISTDTLYAVAIELEDGMFDLNHEIEFKAHLTGIDLGTGSVSFDTESRVGFVVASTMLRGLNNQNLALTDFTVGMLVEVYGFATDSASFQIVLMKQDNNL